jgi:hypothetical protein
MILRQGNGKRICIKNFQRSNPLLLFFRCQQAFAGAGFLQGGFYLIHGNALRIVSGRIILYLILSLLVEPVCG